MASQPTRDGEHGGCVAGPRVLYEEGFEAVKHARRRVP